MMDDQDKQLIDTIKRSYRPEPMTDAAARAFDAGVEDKRVARRRFSLLGWVLVPVAVAATVFALFFRPTSPASHTAA